MNRLLLFSFVLSASLSPLLHGQTLPPDPVIRTGAGEELVHLNELITAYEAQEKALDDEIAPKIKELQEAYAGALKTLAEKLNQPKKPEPADKVREESKRFAKRGMSGEPSKSAPSEVRSAWSGMVKQISVLTQSVALRRESIRSKFLQALSPIERSFQDKNDASGLKAARSARSAVTIRSAIEANRLATTELSGRASNVWQDVAKEGGYLVGFDVAKGPWFQFSVLGCLKPIFATSHGNREGELRGSGQGTTVLAKEGYAVGGLYARGGEVVNCIQLIFMRINPDGLSLNTQDSYLSDWLGGEGGGKAKELNSRGHLVVGVTGQTDSVVNSLGLVYLK